IGDGASLAEAALLAELSHEEAALAADLLIALEILRSSDGLEFTHPIVREAVYADIGAHERAQAHARAAQILVETGGGDERVAAQIVEAEPAGDPDRVELLRRVAADALSRGAPGAAAAWLGRALAEPPPETAKGELLLELGMAKLRLGTPEAAIDQLRDAVELVRDPHLLTTSVRLLGGALTWSGNADRAVNAIGSVIEILQDDNRELALLLEADRAAYAQQGSLALREPVRAWLERHADLPGDTPGERLVLASLAFERARSSESEQEAVAGIERALGGRRLLGEQELDVAGTLYLLVLCLLATDALPLADTCLEQMLADAQARASIPAQAFVIVHRGWASLGKGDLQEAEADARTALDLLTTYDIRLGTRYALALLVRSLVEEGEVEEANRELSHSGFGDDIPPGMANNALREGRALLRLAQGRTREGLDDIVAFGRHDELWGGANPLASRWRSQAALALHAVGEGDRAAGMAREDLERARTWGASSGLGIALRAVALVEGGEASVDRLRDAVDALEVSPARLEHARALTDYGAALRRANRRSEARDVLQRGLDLAQRRGAKPLTERARAELRIAGGRTSDPAATGVAQLTASERRVAELAAEGHSNPEIAQALFVTRKTVETHLGHVYRKLGISGRTKLARALVDPALAADA
ncbi:MAG: LuxR C-terminal-related transcriptional regulator, partial [Gaiellaceae bacterium]